jgi:drug/metabolite transporter (DMT)-like permease
MIFLNQLCFVYSLEFAHASTVSLLFASCPMFVGLIAILVLRTDLGGSFWIGAGLTFAGVALIAVGAGGGLVSGWKGDLLALALAVTWACYTIAIAPLMRRYSPYRISALVLALGWAPLALVSIPQVSRQEFAFSGTVWVGFVYAVIGPLFLTNILWFTSVDRVGAARASIFNNMQPFFGVIFALLILSESLHALEIVGGALIFAGIYLERRLRQPAISPAE